MPLSQIRRGQCRPAADECGLLFDRYFDFSFRVHSPDAGEDRAGNVVPDAENDAGQGSKGIGGEVCRSQGDGQTAVLHTHLDGDRRGFLILHIACPYFLLFHILQQPVFFVAGFSGDPVLLIHKDHAGLVAFCLLSVKPGVGHDDNPVAHADASCRLAVETDHAAAALAADGIGLKAAAVGREFGVFKQYYSQDFKLSFFGTGNLRHSLNKQGKNYYDFAKMLTCFEDVIDSAVGVEVHNRNDEGYKSDLTLDKAPTNFIIVSTSCFLPCFSMFFINLLYIVSIIAGTDIIAVISNSAKFCKICFTPSQYAIFAPLYNGYKNPTVHSKVWCNGKNDNNLYFPYKILLHEG